MSSTLYPAGFYVDRRAHTAHAAALILAALPPGLATGRVADVGCGTGTFLAAARARGSDYVLGIEGNWVTAAMLDDPAIDFQPQDLEAPVSGHRVDLAISLEVAEHLTPGRADSFVADLVALAPAVLFSAAIPSQSGVGHLNEQWQSTWAARFARHGYAAYDLLRPKLWSDDAVPAWYRQNVVLYLDGPTALALGLAATEPDRLDLVHWAFRDRANRELRYMGIPSDSEVLKRQAEQAQQQ